VTLAALVRSSSVLLLRRLHVLRKMLFAALGAFMTAPLAAQSLGRVELYVGHNDALAAVPYLFGGGVSVGGGPVGLRLSGALATKSGTSNSLAQTQTVSLRAWTADADLLFSTNNWRGIPLGAISGVSPYVLLGVGGQTTVPDSVARTAATWSYGAGAAIAMGAGFQLDLEARLRQSASWLAATPAPAFRASEYRVGLSILFGGHHSGKNTRATLPSSSIPARSPGASRPAVGAAARVIPTGERYLGVRYLYGGTSPETGFDCSGFVQFVYARQNVPLPRTSRQMAQTGQRLSLDFGALRVGDLIMFAEDGEPISHVALYAGGNRILHSSSSGGGVRYDDLSTKRGQWFVNHAVAARRVVSDGRSLVSALAFAEGVLHLDGPDHAPRPGR